MTGETSGPSAQDIRMASFEEKFNDLLNFVRLLVKRDTESEKQVEDINKDTSKDNTGGHSHTNSGPPLVQPSKPKEGDFQLDVKLIPNATPENDPSPKGNWNTLEGPQSLQMYGNGEENVMNKKEDDHSDIRSLQGQPLYPSNQGDTIEPHSDVDGHSSKGSEEFEKEAQSPISKKEEPKEVDRRMIPHKRHTPKEYDRKAIRDLASHSPIGQASTKSLSKRETERHRRQGTLMLHTGRYQSSRNLSSSAKLKSEPRKFCTLPMPMDELYPRPGHSLEDCHALKNKVQDLVDHGILRINEGSTPSVIIAWPPERRKDETVIPSPQSQGPTTCGIQPVHLTTPPTLSEVGEHTVPKTQPKLMSNFRNLDDQCSSDKEKAEYCTNRCVTLKRKIQELGHSELEVPTMVQARKPSMHTVPMKKARSTLGFRANGPSRDQTERTISRSTGAWIPHRQG
uniref:Uncharacterized protein n=1 Tax=Fagus sylvatica TaxID=28930 RepID=A0A2N9EPM1_FAGSY